MMSKFISYRDGMLHILRNPGEFTEDLIREAGSAAADHIDLMQDEFKRIAALVPSGTEIAWLCERAIGVTKQRVPVIEQRDRLEREVAALKLEIASLREGTER